MCQTPPHHSKSKVYTLQSLHLIQDDCRLNSAILSIPVVLALGQPYQPRQVSQVQTGRASVPVRYIQRSSRPIYIDLQDSFVYLAAEASLILWFKTTVKSDSVHLLAGDLRNSNQEKNSAVRRIRSVPCIRSASSTVPGLVTVPPYSKVSYPPLSPPILMCPKLLLLRVLPAFFRIF